VVYLGRSTVVADFNHFVVEVHITFPGLYETEEYYSNRSLRVSKAIINITLLNVMLCPGAESRNVEFASYIRQGRRHCKCHDQHVH